MNNLDGSKTGWFFTIAFTYSVFWEYLIIAVVQSGTKGPVLFSWFPACAIFNIGLNGMSMQNVNIYISLGMKGAELEVRLFILHFHCLLGIDQCKADANRIEIERGCYMVNWRKARREGKGKFH